MSLENLDIFFDGVSALCAIIGIIASISAWRSKNSVNETKADIDNYRNSIKEKNNLLKLKPQIRTLKEQSRIFVKLSTGVLPQEGTNKSELDYYKEIKRILNDILNDIPATYDSERSLIKEINTALGYCIENNETFNQVDRTCIYGYSMVEDKFSQVITQLGTIIIELEC